VYRPYGCKLQDLLTILHDSDPAKAEAVVLQRRRVEDGLLSVGLKIHCLGKGRQFLPLVERLGGSKILEMNMFRHSQGIPTVTTALWGCPAGRNAYAYS